MPRGWGSVNGEGPYLAVASLGINPTYSDVEKQVPRGVRVSKISKMANIAKVAIFLAGSFSAVSKRNFARKYAFDSISQALQDLHNFAPLQSQFFFSRASDEQSYQKIVKNNNMLAKNGADTAENEPSLPKCPCLRVREIPRSDKATLDGSLHLQDLGSFLLSPS